METRKLVCNTCGRTYRLKRELNVTEILCFHCGSTLSAETNISTTRIKSKAQPGFETVFYKIAQRKAISTDEIKLVNEMRNEGVVDTAWLKRHYPVDAADKSDEELEVLEEFKPLTYGKYQALYAIGEGAAGIVYKGWEIGSDNIVAIKRLHPEKVSNHISCERFIREVSILRSLSHPNILKLLDGGEQNGEYFLVTPFVEGGSLETVMQELPPIRHLTDVSTLLAILLQIGEALYYAHQQGLVHRDVKPANILLNGKHPYLADFGLAKQIDGENPELTQGAVGTPSYMAPELWDKKATPQGDIYSLAVIFYEIITGQTPFPGRTPEQILAKKLFSPPPLPIPSVSSFPKELNDVILKSLAKEPQRRHSSAKQFTQDLARILS